MAGRENALLSLLQGASNSAASTVSAPVDGLAWIMRKAGLPVPQAPIGGSDWMAQKGLTAEPKNRNMGLLGEALGGISPIVAQAKAPQIAKGLLQGVVNLNAPRTLNRQTGAIVWHGSPHKFDKFDASKIGTGEGAQAYGHGLYVGEARETGLEYQRMLNGVSNYKIDGIQYKLHPGYGDESLKEVLDRTLDLSKGTTLGLLGGKDYLAAMANKKPFDKFTGQPLPKIEADLINKQAAFAKDLLGKNLEPVLGGYLYKVDLPDEQIARMLDWDKPLSQQAPEVQLALETIRERAAKSMPAIANGDPAGRGIYSAYQAHRGGNQSAASERLRELGIPGIRYLDGGSRGAGQGSSNFVVFPGNENMLKILERNGARIR